MNKVQKQFWKRISLNNDIHVYRIKCMHELFMIIIDYGKTIAFHILLMTDYRIITFDL